MPEVLPGVLGVVAEFLLDTEKLEEGKQQLGRNFNLCRVESN